jgi:hypothetical protein
MLHISKQNAKVLIELIIVFIREHTVSQQQIPIAKSDA